MATEGRAADVPRPAAADEVVAVACNQSFTLESGHPLRSVNCLICETACGGEPLIVVGIAALAQPACVCGSVGGDLFMVHARHRPISAQTLAVSIAVAMLCCKPHQIS